MQPIFLFFSDPGHVHWTWTLSRTAQQCNISPYSTRTTSASAGDHPPLTKYFVNHFDIPPSLDLMYENHIYCSLVRWSESKNERLSSCYSHLFTIEFLLVIHLVTVVPLPGRGGAGPSVSRSRSRTVKMKLTTIKVRWCISFQGGGAAKEENVERAKFASLPVWPCPPHLPSNVAPTDGRNFKQHKL